MKGDDSHKFAVVVGLAVFTIGMFWFWKRRQKRKMEDEAEYMQVFLDLLPNQPKNERSRENFREMLREKLEGRLADSVERIWDLPAVVLKLQGAYLDLLLESRELYVAGYFYSCVAMCGIVGERLVKDVLRVSVLIQKAGTSESPSEKAFDQFERVEVNGIVNFLKEAAILDKEAAKAARDLSELRNAYAHARGKDPKSDALKAIQLLHTLVKDTVSVLKEFEIKDGAFVRKAVPAADAPDGA